MSDSSLGDDPMQGESGAVGRRVSANPTEVLMCGLSHELSELENPSQDTDSKSPVTPSNSPIMSMRSKSSKASLKSLDIHTQMGSKRSKSPSTPSNSPELSLKSPTSLSKSNSFKSITTPPNTSPQSSSPVEPANPILAPSSKRSTSSQSLSIPSTPHSPLQVPSSRKSSRTPSPTPKLSSSGFPFPQSTPDSPKSPQNEKKTSLAQNGNDVTRPPLQRSSDVEEQSLDSPLPDIADIQPRFANFLQSTNTKVLIRNQSMEEVVQKIHEGSSLWKVRGVNKWFNRHYRVDVDNMSLIGESKKWWSPGGGIVPLLDITEVRAGWKSDTFNKVSSHSEKLKEKAATGEEPLLDEIRCFSVIHGAGGREVLDLVASSEEERDAWVAGLSHLVQSVRVLHEERQYDVWLRRQFQEADKDNNGSLNFSECCALIKQLNIKMDKTHAKKLFNQANTSKQKRDGEQVLEVEEFVNFYHSLLKMPQIEKLYKTYASDKTLLMSAEQLKTFLQREQKLNNMDITGATVLINDYELSDLKAKGYMTQDGFYHMLLSSMFDVFNNDHQSKIHQDMNQSLSHYFISSSHNTYLTGHQLAGESSVEGYISALKKGCRLLELDVWDGDDGEPIIYHGHTLTSKITLADVLRDGIKAYAFEASPYPVILSIENHLSIEQQKVMVKQMKEILGDMLMTEPVSEDLIAVPSPESMKNKIIIRGKKPQGTEIESDDDDDDEQDTIDYIDSDDGTSQSKKKHHKPLAPELSEVVNVCEGKKFISFQDAYQTYKCVHTPSLGETKAKGFIESSSDEFLKFTERNVTKVYPLGTRTDSSNLKPYPFWSVGCQIVALNMQTEDKANFYNDALFRTNGSCGYVLKPGILLRDEPYSPSELTDRYRKVLRVTILSGQHLPNSVKKGDIVDPYVQVKVRGHPEDKQKQRTKVVKNNGFNPVWDETLELSIGVPQVSLVYFSLRDESSLARDPVLALCCIPFTSLAPGYRFVHFTDMAGKGLAPSALFVHVEITDK